MNRPKLPVLVELPAGVDHGTPAGFTTGCRKPASCPAVYWHGMCCQYAHVREMTDNRYHAARRADPAPSAIARALGFRPVLAPEGLTIPPRPVTPHPAGDSRDRAGGEAGSVGSEGGVRTAGAEGAYSAWHADPVQEGVSQRLSRRPAHGAHVPPGRGRRRGRVEAQEPTGAPGGEPPHPRVGP